MCVCVSVVWARVLCVACSNTWSLRWPNSRRRMRAPLASTASHAWHILDKLKINRPISCPSSCSPPIYLGPRGRWSVHVVAGTPHANVCVCVSVCLHVHRKYIYMNRKYSACLYTICMNGIDAHQVLTILFCRERITRHTNCVRVCICVLFRAFGKGFVCVQNAFT